MRSLRHRGYVSGYDERQPIGNGDVWAYVDGYNGGPGDGDEVAGRDLLRSHLHGMVRASDPDRDAHAKIWF